MIEAGLLTSSGSLNGLGLGLSRAMARSSTRLTASLRLAQRLRTSRDTSAASSHYATHALGDVCWSIAVLPISFWTICHSRSPVRWLRNLYGQLRRQELSRVENSYLAVPMIIIIADPPTVENASFMYESHMVIVRMGATSSMLMSFSDHPEHVVLANC